jgi:hypothetical protein
MLNVDPALLARYRTRLLEDAAPIAEQSSYVKWLRYYLDFCSKYRFSNRQTESLRPFLNKLEEERQTKAQQEQAGRAIRLYYEMWSSGSDQSTEGSGGQSQTSATAQPVDRRTISATTPLRLSRPAQRPEPAEPPQPDRRPRPEPAQRWFKRFTHISRGRLNDRKRLT